MVNSCSVSSAVDFLNCFSTLTMVCGSSSRLIQVTFSPDFTVKVGGLKAKSLISILFCFLLVLSSFFISPAIAKRDRLRKAIPHKSAATFFLALSVIIFWEDLAEVRIDNRERRLALQILHAREAEHAPQFFSRHLEGAGIRRRSRRRLRKSSRHGGMERHVTFYFLKHLVDVTVKHCHGAKALQVSKRSLAVACAPAPLRINRPEWDMRKHNNRRARSEILNVGLEPLKLLIAELS